MKRFIKTFTALILALCMSASSIINAFATTQGNAGEIIATEMTTEQASNNVDKYFSNDEWASAYPEGLFMLEYSSYEISEGGTDEKHPEDVYLGINIYRIGGNSLGSTVTYQQTCILGDEEIYPASQGEIEFMPGQKKATVKVRIINDDKRNGDQMLLFSLTDSTTGEINASLGASTAIKIHDDEPYVTSEIKMYAENTVTDASQGGVVVNFSRTVDTEYVSFHISTANGTAKKDVDYTEVDTVVIFAVGQTEQQITIPIIQSDDTYTIPKNLTLKMDDFKGCKPADADEIRLDITNKPVSSAQKLTDVSDSKADLEVSDGDALADSNESVININDKIDRAQLLRTAFGSINGTAAQSTGKNTLKSNTKSGGWGPTVDIPASDFNQLYNSYKKDWSAGSVYSYGNEELLIATKNSYNLNHFYSVVARFKNVDNFDIRDNPNTAFGYLTKGGKSDKTSKFSSTTAKLSSASADNIKWMNDNELFVLINENDKEIEWLNSNNAELFQNNNGRYTHTTGIDGAQQKLFYMLYDDSGWNDNNFEVGTTTLNRAVLPFSVFNTDKVSDFSVVVDENNLNESYVSFVMDSYKWTITANTANGGVGETLNKSSDSDEDRYGFYIGSTLNVEFNVVSASENVTSPEYLYLCDADGNIHSSAKIGSDTTKSFSIPMETIMTKNISDLTDKYYMTKEEAQQHINNTLTSDGSISPCFNSKLHFKATFSRKQSVVLNFKNYPVLSTPMTLSDGSIESASVHKSRVENALVPTIDFDLYDGTKGYIPSYKIDLEDCTLTFDPTEFEYLNVKPLALDPELEAGEESGIVFSANLTDLEYTEFTDNKRISADICAQITSDIVFTVYDENTTYLEPSIVMDTAIVSSRTDGVFNTVFAANPLDEYVPFEALYWDTTENPKLSYYGLKFSISDIYVGSMSGDVKDFNVNVYYDTTTGTERTKLFSFTYHGGADKAEAAKVDLRDLNSLFTDVDTAEDSLINASDYKPFVEFLDYTTSGYTYMIYIPTYYNYHNENDPLYAYYKQLIKGADGISIELNDYAKEVNTQLYATVADSEGTVDDGTSRVIDSVEVQDTQYTAMAVPKVKLYSPQENGTMPYYEQQKDFYTYNDHIMAMNAMNMNIDATTIFTALSKVFAMAKGPDSKVSKVTGFIGGSGVYVNYNQGVITAGAKVGGNVPADKSQKKDDLALVKDEEALDVATVDPALANQHKVDKIKAANTYKKKFFSGFIEYKMQFTYNYLTHKFDFSKFSFAADVSYTFTKSIPFLYVCFMSIAVKGSININAGASYVLSYVDQDGNENYTVTWDGVIITPGIAVSIGAGIGIGGVLEFIQIYGSLVANMGFTLMKYNYVAPQQEFDIKASPSPVTYKVKNNDATAMVVSYSGNWKNSKTDYVTPQTSNIVTVDPTNSPDVEYFSFGKTLCKSTTKGDSITITGKGTSLQLVCAKTRDSGNIKVVIKSPDGLTEYYNQSVSLKCDGSIQPYQLAMSWQLDDYTNADEVPFVATITTESEDVNYFDSFRVYNDAYHDESECVPAKVSSATVRLGVGAKIHLFLFSLNFDLAYMLVSKQGDKSSITLYGVGYTYTENLSSVSAPPLRTADTSDDLPLVTVDGLEHTGSLSSSDYFDTGEFSAEKEKTLLSGDINDSSKTQVICYNGDEYTFYTLTDCEDSSKAYYKLYYSVNGVEKGVVSQEVYVSDFNAFIDGNGKLAVQMIASDSSVKGIKQLDDGKVALQLNDANSTEITVEDSDDIAEVLKRTCVKVATVNESGEFDSAKVIEGTDSSQGATMQDYLPVGVATEKSMLLYVQDTKTADNAEYDLNWTAFNNDIEKTSDNLNAVINSIYTGRAELFASVKTGDTYSKSQKISLDYLGEKALKPGFKISALDAMAVDKTTVAMSYVIEVPNSTYDGKTGTLKELHYRQGTVDGNGNVSFDDNAVVVDSVFDFDEDISTIYPDYTENLSSKYYDSKTGEPYSTILLSNIQIENAIIGSNSVNGVLYPQQPVIFYQTNESINYVTYDTLQQIRAGETPTDSVGKLYDKSFEDYVIAVSQDGTINLIYIDSEEEDASYVDTLYITDFDAEHNAWNKPRQLTYSDVFDREAFENKEYTASLEVKHLSAYLDNDGDVSVAFKSTYAPFTYNYVTNESYVYGDYAVDISDHYDRVVMDGEDATGYITVPVQDYESEYARNDVFSISFKERVTAIDVTSFELYNKVFVENQQIYLQFDIENTGDDIIDELDVNLYYYTSDKSSVKIMEKTLTGMLLAGDYYKAEMEYFVDSAYIPDGAVLGVDIRQGKKTLFSSYDDYLLNTDSDKENDTTVSYYIVNNQAEIYFDGTDVDIDSNGIMNFKANIGNAGNVDAQNDVTVYFKTYSVEEGVSDPEYNGTLFSFTVGKDRLKAKSTTFVSDSFDVSQYLEEGKLYYNFELVTEDSQYDTENDILEVVACYQEPEIEINSVDKYNLTSPYNGENILNLKLGEEFEIDASVISSYYTENDLVAYEIGTNCLSVDNSLGDGKIKVKVIDLPENKDSYVKVLINIKDTVIYKYLYLHISNTSIIDFDTRHTKFGWKQSKQSFVYATNFRMLYTETDNSKFDFNFVGKSLKIYGDLLKNGGDFRLQVTDVGNNTVIDEIVSTKAKVDNPGMLIYKKSKLPLGHYNVKITSVLDEGEMLSLDKAKFKIDDSNADVTPYATVEHKSEQLDAPMLSGRQRQAKFTLTFSENIKLVEGKSLEDIILEFDEYESTGSAFEKTGNKVIFKATEISGNKLIFKSDVSSKTGSVMKYVLADSAIPENCLVTADDMEVKTAIPSYNTVSYELRESGIMTAVVAEDTKMPDGSVQQSIRVKFMTTPDTDRLKGTKLLYKTTNAKGEESFVEFDFAEVTEDPRTVIYRAEKLELEADEISKIFAFEEGIVLNENNYVLVTADGEYLENNLTTVINDTSELDIYYNKLKANEAPIIFVNDGKASVKVDFEKAVDISDSDALVKVSQKITDNATGVTETNEIILNVISLENDGKAIVFTTDKAEAIPTGKTVEYKLTSEKIEFSSQTPVKCEYDKIAINPELENAKTLTYNTDAYIKKVTPYLTDNFELYADVVFSNDVSKETLENTTVEVTELVKEYDASREYSHTLEFESVSVINGVCTATYKLKDKTVEFAYEEVEKQFVVNEFKSEKPVVTVDGKEFTNEILMAKKVSTQRAKVKDAEISLLDNGEMGYNVMLTLTFDDNITMQSKDGVYAGITKECGGTESEILLPPVEAVGNKLTFITQTPITLEADEVTSFETTGRFVDKFGFVCDSKGVAVNRTVEDNAQLISDNTDKGIAENVRLKTDYSQSDKVKLNAEVRFDQKLRPQSFEGSQLEIYQYIEYTNGEFSVVKLTLEFEEVIEDDVAIFSGEFELPDDCVKVRFSTDEGQIITDSLLYNETKTLSLSKALPKAHELVVEKQAPATVSILSKKADGTIDDLSSTVIAVTYKKKITASDLGGISLVAKVTGVENTDTVRYVAKCVYMDNTVAFVPEKEITGELANVVTISLEDAILSFENGASVITAETGIPVSPLVVDSTREFVINNPDSDTTLPTQPDSTLPEATEKPTQQVTEPQSTESTEENQTQTTKPENETQSQQGGTTPTNNKDDSSKPLTGDNGNFALVMVVALMALAIFVYVLRKNKTNSSK